MSNPINALLLQPSPLGEEFVSVNYVTGLASYTTGGQTVSANTFAMLYVKYIISGQLSASGTYYVRALVPTNGGGSVKLLWYVAATAAQVTAATNLSAETIAVMAVGV